MIPASLVVSLFSPFSFYTGLTVWPAVKPDRSSTILPNGRIGVQASWPRPLEWNQDPAQLGGLAYRVDSFVLVELWINVFPCSRKEGTGQTWLCLSTLHPTVSRTRTSKKKWEERRKKKEDGIALHDSYFKFQSTRNAPLIILRDMLVRLTLKTSLTKTSPSTCFQLLN